jgi:hypothetical protein
MHQIFHKPKKRKFNEEKKLKKKEEFIRNEKNCRRNLESRFSPHLISFHKYIF